MGEIRALCISEKRGTQKHALDRVFFMTEFGIDGDAHAGDWHRQVSLLGLGEIDDFRARGADVDFGGDVLLHGVVAGGDLLVREATDDRRDAVAEAEQLLAAVGLVITHGVRESGLRQSAHALCDGDECFGFFHRE